MLGVDGCATGWIAASRDARGRVTCRRVATLEELLGDLRPPSVAAVDVPIGLPERGARACDELARRLLGVRRVSVFPPPIRPVLAATSYAEASSIRFAVDGKRMSIQAWAIVPRIAEMDRFLDGDPVRRAIVHEAHPEVSFLHLGGGRPMAASKHTSAGRARRWALLRRWRRALPHPARTARTFGCKVDDVLDALVLLWTAERIRRGRAIRIPATPPLDARGLRMEIVA
ncbi:MAG TPA: DUF429 domain-containing protein [Candidatus Tectomicrobia bacterium]|nr:DUF429 domain-containing protein [Candidatus Tectomicrobia bacterium]